MRRRATALALLASVVASACTAPPPEESPFLRSSPSAAPTGTVPPIAPLPAAGQPYTGEELLALMRGSRRPGGVPEALLADGVARGVAEQIWTLDGRPWDTAAASGSCTSATACRLELSGSHAGAGGEDVWIFEVDPAAGTVSVVESVLGSLPPGLAASLDTAARRLTDLDGLRLTATRWRPPAEGGGFDLSYRDAGEEGSCTVELTLDAAAGELLEQRRVGC